MKKRNAYRTGGLALKIVGLACASCVLAGCLGVGFATAAGGVSHDMQTFGISEVSTPGSASASAESLSDQAADASVTATSRLAAAGTRDISKGVAAIEAEEEAAMVCFLASDDASYITGSVNTIDGGWSVGYSRDF